MGHWSKVVWSVAALACASPGGVVAAPAAVARPMVLAPHAMMRPPIGSRGRGLGIGRGARMRLRGAQVGYGDALGLAGVGLDTIGAGFAAPPPDDVGPYPPPLPPPFALLPPPPRCPLIIEVGRGLAHRATTRIVSGTPACRR